MTNYFHSIFCSNRPPVSKAGKDKRQHGRSIFAISVPFPKQLAILLVGTIGTVDGSALNDGAEPPDNVFVSAGKLEADCAIR